jgi:hypothetical protein
MSGSSAQISLATVLVPNPNLFLREEGKTGGILFDPDTGSVRILNITAAETWKLFDGRRSVAQIIAALREKFDGLDATAEAKLLELLGQFTRVGAVSLRVDNVP